MKTIYLSLSDTSALTKKLKAIPGVNEATEGYVNGRTCFPNKDEVSNGSSGHAFGLKVTFDEDKVSLNSILSLFISSIDPYAPYEENPAPTRAGFYYTDLLDGVAADSFFSSSLEKGWNIVVTKMTNFFRA